MPFPANNLSQCRSKSASARPLVPHVVSFWEQITPTLISQTAVSVFIASIAASQTHHFCIIQKNKNKDLNDMKSSYLTQYLCSIYDQLGHNMCLINHLEKSQRDRLFWKRMQIHTVECRYSAVQYNKIFHTALLWVKHDINQCQITKYTPYLALTGELWSEFCETSNENWPR